MAGIDLLLAIAMVIVGCIAIFNACDVARNTSRLHANEKTIKKLDDEMSEVFGKLKKLANIDSVQNDDIKDIDRRLNILTAAFHENQQYQQLQFTKLDAKEFVIVDAAHWKSLLDGEDNRDHCGEYDDEYDSEYNAGGDEE